MGKASRGAAYYKCMLDAIDLAYLPVVLEITGYATIYSVLCAAPGLKPIWLPETGAFLNVDLSRFSIYFPLSVDSTDSDRVAAA